MPPLELPDELPLLAEDEDEADDDADELLDAEVLEISAPPVLVEVDPPLDVDEITMLPLDPPLPPKPPPNPPPKPPPKKPPLPPTTAGTLPPPAAGPAPPPPIYPSPTGTGAALAIRTTVGAQVVRVVVTRRTRGRDTAASWGWATRLTRTRLVFAVRAGRSATCTAPPPIRAPPHAHAHNLAKAIRTDISFLSRCRHPRVAGSPFAALVYRYLTNCKTKR